MHTSVYMNLSFADPSPTQPRPSQATQPDPNPDVLAAAGPFGVNEAQTNKYTGKQADKCVPNAGRFIVGCL